MIFVSLALVILCTAWTVLGAMAVRFTLTRPSRRCVGARVGVSVLKPLCGVDPALQDNLESFFQQTYPHMELVFGVVDPSDPAIAIVQTLVARYPNVSAKLVIHAGRGAMNPKVDNILGMLPVATHDMILVSDSNVHAPPHYVDEAMATFRLEPDVGLVTNLFAGCGESGLGSALQNAQLNGFAAAGAALPTCLGDPLVIGKSMLLSRARFEALGGFERVANVVAEDFVIGKMVQHGGYQVRMAPSVLRQMTHGLRVRDFFARELRWATLRRRLRPEARWLEIVLNPLAVWPFAWGLFGLRGSLLWIFGVLFVRDVVGWLQLRGPRRLWIAFAFGWLRELLALAVWIMTPFTQHVVWRGHRVRLGAGTLAFREAARGASSHPGSSVEFAKEHQSRR